MMNFKKSIALVCLSMLFITSAFGQTWSILDAQGSALRASIIATLTTEFGTTIGQTAALNKLAKIEKDYNRRRGAIDPFSLHLAGVMHNVISNTKDKIDDINHGVSDIAARRLFFKHGIKKIESKVAIEKGYLEEIENDETLIQALSVSKPGGSGHVYTSYMKLLLRTMEIHKKVLALEHEVKNLNSMNRIFIR